MLPVPEAQADGETPSPNPTLPSQFHLVDGRNSHTSPTPRPREAPVQGYSKRESPSVPPGAMLSFGICSLSEKREGGPEPGYVGSQAKVLWASLSQAAAQLSVPHSAPTGNPRVLLDSSLSPLPLPDPGTPSVSPPKTSSPSTSPSYHCHGCPNQNHG